MSEQNLDFGQVVTRVLGFAERHLTPISIGVLGVGVVLLFTAGPGRGLIQRTQAVTQPVEESATTAEQAEAPVAFLQNSGGGSMAAQPVFERAPQPFTIVPQRQRDEIVPYTVQPGDTIFDLADRFNLNMETIFWANSETLQDNVHLLVPGVELFILPINGVYHRANGDESIAEIAERFYADPNEILDAPYNELPVDANGSYVPPLGMRLVVPGGEREQIDFAWVAPATDTTPGGSGQSDRVVFAPGHPGSCNVAIGGGAGTGSWASPVGAFRLTQGYFFGHTGVDLSSTIGEPVYAADSGQVVFAGWNDWGYGNLVAINHGAWTTLYAHLNSINVGCGQAVSRGSQIGGIGSTGNSSGPHLHFEMRFGLGLTPDNPAAYIGF